MQNQSVQHVGIITHQYSNSSMQKAYFLAKGPENVGQFHTIPVGEFVWCGYFKQRFSSRI